MAEIWLEIVVKRQFVSVLFFSSPSTLENPFSIMYVIVFFFWSLWFLAFAGQIFQFCGRPGNVDITKYGFSFIHFNMINPVCWLCHEITSKVKRFFSCNNLSIQALYFHIYDKYVHQKPIKCPSYLSNLSSWRNKYPTSCSLPNLIQVPSLLWLHYKWAFHSILVTWFLVVFGNEVTKILHNRLFTF